MALHGFPIPDFESGSDDPHYGDVDECIIEMSPEDRKSLHENCGLTLRSSTPIKSSNNSAVFIAESSRDGSLCALKVTPHKKRIQNEYSNRKQIPDSPYLVKSNFILESPNRAVLEMEFCEYGDIRNKKFDSKTILHLMHDIGSALSIIHSHGFLHLDVSPGNILYSGQYFKLADFGTMIQDGKFTDGCEGAGPYVSPEALAFPNNLYPVSYPIDIFSFGVVLLEVATGIPAPRGGSQGYLDLRHNKIKLGTGKYLTDISNILVDLINAMLKENPKQRPSAADIVSITNSVKF